jgi:hypothetical protein
MPAIPVTTHSGFLAGLADSSLGDRLAEVDRTAGDGPVAVVDAPDHQDVVGAVGHDDVDRLDDAAGLGASGVVVVVDSSPVASQSNPLPRSSRHLREIGARREFRAEFGTLLESCR